MKTLLLVLLAALFLSAYSKESVRVTQARKATEATQAGQTPGEKDQEKTKAPEQVQQQQKPTALEVVQAPPVKAQPAPAAPTEQAKKTELTPSEMKGVLGVLVHLFREQAAQVMTPFVDKQDQAQVTGAQFSGNQDQAQVKILMDDKSELLFQNLKIDVTEAAKAKSGEYNFVSLCIDSECEILFNLLYKIKEEKVFFSWPLYFKKVEGQYAFATPQEGYEKVLEEEAGFEEEPPAQLKVEKLLEKNAEKLKVETHKLIHARMSATKSIYSALVLVNVRKLKTQFKTVQEGISFDVAIEFSDKKAARAFSGLVRDKDEEAGQGDSTAHVQPIVKGLLLFTFDQKNYVTPLPRQNRALQSMLCQLYVEKNETFHACQMVASSEVLGMLALEGRVEGPVLVGFRPVEENGKLVDKPIIEMPGKN